MMSHRANIQGRIARIAGVVLAVASLGAAPDEPWETVRSSLPPFGAAPGSAAPAEPGGYARYPAGHPSADAAAPAPGGVIPAGNQVPVPPPALPAAPAAPRAANTSYSMVMPAPAAPRIPGRIGSVEAIGPVAAMAPAHTYAPTSTRVYVINGVDPFGWGGLAQMTERIRESGYPDTRFGGWFEILKFDREIRAAHRQDPGAQFVIIGYSFGVYRAGHWRTVCRATAFRWRWSATSVAITSATPPACRRAARAS